MVKRLLIVAHAPSENTLCLREATERGALSETGIEVRVVAPLQAGPDDVLEAQAVILGTTENLGYMSGALKDFFDRSYNPLLEKTQGLPYALYIRAGSDATGTRRGVETITTGLRWRARQEPLLSQRPWQQLFLRQCEQLGAAIGAGSSVMLRIVSAVDSNRGLWSSSTMLRPSSAAGDQAWFNRRRKDPNARADGKAPSLRGLLFLLLVGRVGHHHGNVGRDVVRR